MPLFQRYGQQPRTCKVGSWFLPCLLTVCLLPCLVACSDTDGNSGQAVQSVAVKRLDAANLSDAQKHSHLADGVITTTTLTVNNSVQYADATHLPYANPNAPKGGVLSMPAIGMFNSVNSFIDQGVPATGTFYLYDTLMAGSLDEAFVLYPQLAEKVTHNPDDKSWIIYHIHPKARFWDGSAVTADDVKSTFEHILTNGLMSWRSFLGGIIAIETLDQHRVKFYFDEGASADLGMTVGLMPIFAKKDIDARFSQPSLTPLLGSGAYRLDIAEPSRRIRYVRDANYWGDDVMVNRGRFNFDAIEYQYFADDAVAFEAFKSGQYQFRTEADIKRWASFDPKQNNLPIIKSELSNQNPVLMQGLVINLRKAKFSDIRVRRALNLAFDFEWVNAQLLYGEYQRLNSYFYGSNIAAKGKPSAEELVILQSLPLSEIEQSALDGVPTQPVSAGDGINRDNLLKARQLLLQAGFGYQNGQLIDQQGKVVSIEILVADDKHQAILLPYVKNLQRLGFDASIRRMDNASYLARKRAFNFDMIIDSFMQGNAPGAEQAYLWGSAAADEMGNQNTIGIKSHAIDAIITKLAQATTRHDVEIYAKVLDRLLLAGEYMIPWYGKNSTDVMYYHGYQHPNRLPTNSIGLDYWWYDAQQE